jgi:hypothetical protein
MNTVLFWEGRRIDDVRKFCEENGYDLVWVQDYRYVPPRAVPVNEDARLAQALQEFLTRGGLCKCNECLKDDDRELLEEILVYLQSRAEYMETGESEEPVGPPYVLPAPFVDHHVPAMDDRGIYTRILYREKVRS